MRWDTARSARLLREARLRAGLSQQQLAEVSGKDRTVIARYEQGVVAPSIDTLVGMRRGFEDLRWGGTPEPIGDGLRPQVASLEDLARMSAALAYELGREPGREAERLRQLEIDHSRELRRIMDAELDLRLTLGREHEIEHGIDI